MKKTLLTFSLLMLTNQAMAEASCEQKLVADIPDFLQQYQLSLSVAGQSFPVTADSSEVCVSRRSLNIYPRAFSNARVALVIANGEQQMEHLLFSYSHLAADEVKVGFPSTVISMLCPTSECGYSEYLYLQQNSQVQKIAADYQQQVADLVAHDPEAIFDRSKLMALDNSGLRQTSILTDAFPEPFPAYSNPDLPDDYFFMAGSSASFMDPLMTRILTTEARQPFENLTDADMPGEQVLAYWMRYAHQHVPDVDNFAELFSTRFQVVHFPTIRQTPSLLIALGDVIQVYPRLSSRPQDWDALSRVQFNYHGQFERNGNQLWLESNSEQIGFVYEKGAWRLDHICQMDRSTFEICATPEA